MVDGHTVWVQVLLVLVAFALSSLIGLERQIRQKSAGLRTHALVGMGSALFMVVSKWGFADVLGPHVSLDPSRIAAQIVSGIGFIGGGLIFVRRDAVRGLTTASVVWVTAAVGAAAGAGMVVVAIAATAAHFAVIIGFTALGGRLPSARGVVQLRIVYTNGSGAFRRALVACTHRGFEVGQVTIERGDLLADPVDEGRGNGHLRGTPADRDGGEDPNARAGDVVVALQLYGSAPVEDLAAQLTEVAGVRSVLVGAGTEEE
ncbi:MgtC/SapB family protein [Actinopolymorpha rutila]|uniref:Putative Mg2+ transporter-C (MgtC) family protein n=1 Tax=Actinopolymorpha rutila TaxID=446787 RepID=A0A852ZKV9_9ACTN|nr:MgtC/SapB family protein [Actinopolymorpha rutila]NYH89026.1 putative Mg2+ transporter-C (MgtC) family protein [Actinopolymorpha rutila]